MQREFKIGDCNISPNSSGEWIQQDINEAFIWIEQLGTCEGVSLNLHEAQQVVNTLNQIIDFYKNQPKIGDRVKIIEGRFTGLEGKVKDIDICDSQRPLHIRLDDTKEMENCHYFCGYDCIEKINE